MESAPAEVVFGPGTFAKDGRAPLRDGIRLSGEQPTNRRFSRNPGYRAPILAPLTCRFRADNIKLSRQFSISEGISRAIYPS